MAKSSFTVFIGVHGMNCTAIYGVTSIMPNLNGFLFNTEDGHDVQIDCPPNDDGIDHISFEYGYSNRALENIKKLGSYIVHDHREK